MINWDDVRKGAEVATETIIGIGNELLKEIEQNKNKENDE